MGRFYTRLPDAQALQFAEDSLGIDGSQPYTILDSAAKLAQDGPRSTAWYFLLHVQTPAGQKFVYTGDRPRPQSGGGRLVPQRLRLRRTTHTSRPRL
jgi:hypothetical protein